MKSVICSCGAKVFTASMIAECGDCKHFECEHEDAIIESCNGAECGSDCNNFEPFYGIAQESCGHGCMLLTCGTCKKDTAIVYGE